MKNELFHIGSLTIYGYGLMIAIGVLAAYLTAVFRAKRKNLEHERIFDLTIWCVIGGFAGAKLLYYITIIDEIVKDPKVLLDASDGMVVFGGIIFGILAGYLYCKRHKLNFLEYFDLVMPSIAIAQGFGRIGCFLAGCCYGVETHSFIGITFEHSSYAKNGVPLVPTQLISSGLNFIHFFVLIILAKRIKAHGVIAGCYLMFYSAGRFVIEFFRGDLIRGNVGTVSTSQFISIFTFLLGVAIIIIQLKRGRKETTQEQKDSTVDEEKDKIIQEQTESTMEEQNSETTIEQNKGIEEEE